MIEHILFDLGGVILQIDIGAFARSLSSRHEKASQDARVQELDQVALGYEKGDFTENEFVERIQQFIPYAMTKGQILEAWNNILCLPFQASREFLERMRPSYDLALLSNTNATHRKSFDHIFDNQWGNNQFYNLFQQVFYSYEMKMAKPQPEIYVAALSFLGWEPRNTLFIDDSQVNVDAAARLGMHTWRFGGIQDWTSIGQAFAL